MKRKNRLTGTMALILACLLFFGCVNQQGSFVTNPPGAIVIVGDQAKLAPCKFEFPPGTEKAKIHCAANGPELEIKIPQPDDEDERKNFLGNCAFYVSAAMVTAVLISLAALAAYGGAFDVGPLLEPVLCIDEKVFLPTLEENIDLSGPETDQLKE